MSFTALQLRPREMKKGFAFVRMLIAKPTLNKETKPFL
jgi:hypothetical protein